VFSSCYFVDRFSCRRLTYFLAKAELGIASAPTTDRLGEMYLAMVAGFGFGVSSETTNISSEEMMTIGTTGMKPNTAVPPGVRDRTSVPPIEYITVAGPGAGAGTNA
jgi:hypothetical protein